MRKKLFTKLTQNYKCLDYKDMSLYSNIRTASIIRTCPYIRVNTVGICRETESKEEMPLL